MVVHKHEDKRNSRTKMTLRRGDMVLVIAGKDRGKRGKIVAVFPEKNRVEVENVNIVKRHLRRQGAALQAGIIEKPAPISRSNVMLLCPACGKPTRVAHEGLPEGTQAHEKHVRVCKQCGEPITVENPRA
jgi:large subunit ribosomal protein L24